MELRHEACRVLDECIVDGFGIAMNEGVAPCLEIFDVRPDIGKAELIKIITVRCVEENTVKPIEAGANRAVAVQEISGHRRRK
jgi:hypothetical protein